MVAQANQAAETRRVWLDDSDLIFRRGMSAVLEASGFGVVRETQGLVAQPGAIDEPDLEFDGLIFEAENGGLMRAVHVAEESNCRLIAVLRSNDEQLIGEVMGAGASAMLLRESLRPATFVAAVGAALNGTTVLPSDIFDNLLAQTAIGRTSSNQTLRPREVAVLQCLSEGHDTREIAQDLGYSERTVKNVVHDVLTKMNCRNRAHAVATAARTGLI